MGYADGVVMQIEYRLKQIVIKSAADNLCYNNGVVESDIDLFGAIAVVWLGWMWPYSNHSVCSFCQQHWLLLLLQGQSTTPTLKLSHSF